MLRFNHVDLRRGTQPLLADVDITLQNGWKVGVTGRNGCGKSSLFAAIEGELDTDKGQIDLPQDVRMAISRQEAPAGQVSALDYVLTGDAAAAQALAALDRAEAADDAIAMAHAHHQLEALKAYDAPARAGRLLHGLGFQADTHKRPVSAFSGGWRVRLALAKALMCPSDLLLLDEPTNHLDLDAIVWLEKWLRQYQGMLLVISHDREFLDGVSDHILHLEAGKAAIYTGNYSAFTRQYAEKMRQMQLAHERQQAERQHLQAFIDRFRAKATKARQAQSRVKRLQKLADTQAVRTASTLSFNFSEPERIPQSMLEITDGRLGYGHEKVVLSDVGIAIESGDRVGLLGPNGAGKSTLVKSLAGDLPLLGGERRGHKDLVIGYFAQHTVENLQAGETPDHHLAHIASTASSQQRRDYLGRWGFPGDKALEVVDHFSGGERARLALALIAWQAPNLLILDEPTNHLDMDMREALAQALNYYPGALLLVAHDRHLLGLVCDEFWRVADGKVTPFAGDLDDYAKWLAEHGHGDAPSNHGDAKPSNASRQDLRRQAAHKREQTRALRKRYQQIDRELNDLNKRLESIQKQLEETQIYTQSPQLAMDLGREQGQLRARQETLENTWLELDQAIEEAMA